jgi:hypothetical protein
MKDKLKEAIEEVFKDMVPFIKQVGPDCYHINCNSNIFIVTNRKRAEAFDRALKEEASKIFK